MSVKHMVVFKFKPEIADEQITGFMNALADFKGRIDGFVDFEWGPYAGPFKGGEGANKGFTHGFVMTWKDWKSRNEYLPHPIHQSFLERWIWIVEDFVAFDFEA